MILASARPRPPTRRSPGRSPAARRAAASGSLPAKAGSHATSRCVASAFRLRQGSGGPAVALAEAGQAEGERREAAADSTCRGIGTAAAQVVPAHT